MIAGSALSLVSIVAGGLLSWHNWSGGNSFDADTSRTFGERLADRIASFGGSWTFIILFGGSIIAWVIVNTVILLNWGNGPFDPYPFILLNLFLSMVASIQAPIIMMSQNRQAEHDRVDAAHDYEVNLKAELEIMVLHEKMDLLKDTQWSELISIQQEQLRLLNRLTKDRTENP